MLADLLKKTILIAVNVYLTLDIVQPRLNSIEIRSKFDPIYTVTDVSRRFVESLAISRRDRC